MKTALKISKTELRILFFSPIAWFLLVIFIIQCAVTYFNALEFPVTTQEIGGMGLKYLPPLTFFTFSYPGQSVFYSVIEKLYLFVPLLTMGLISRETSSGTMKLLYSSPIRVSEIIFGKFLAMMVYNLLLVLLLSIFVVSGLFHIRNADGGMLLSGCLGVYLLLLAYSSIGLFMSCLTTYQIVAAICTFVMIGVLTYIGGLWQDVDFVRNLTYYLSLSGRTEKMLGGLITTNDVLYFFVIVYIFLGLSIYKLRAAMESKPPGVKAARYIAVVVSALLLGYITSLPALTGYLDLTANKANTLSKSSQQIVKELAGAPLQVTAFDNLLDDFSYVGLPDQRNTDLARWDKYIRFKNDINLNYIYYYDSVLTTRAEQEQEWYGGETLDKKAEKWIKATRFDRDIVKTPAEIRQLADLRPELNRYVMQLKWKDRVTYLRVFNDQRVWPSETEMAAAFKRLLAAKMPKIAFVTGNLERGVHKSGDRDYKTMTNFKTYRYSLINQGFDVDTISPETQEIPEGITALVLADPKMSLSPAAQNKLQQYIDRGGNLFIAGEPGRQDILNPLLQQFGVQLKEGQIAQQSRDNSPDLAIANPIWKMADLFKPLKYAMNDSQKVTMPGVAALSYADTGGYSVEPILWTDSKTSWNKKKKMDLDMVTAADASAYQPRQVAVRRDQPVTTAPAIGTLTFSAEEGDERGSFATMLRLTRKVNGKEQRIIISGDADFLNNAELGRFNIQTANFLYSTTLFSWLSYSAFPIDASHEEEKDKRLNLTVSSMRRIKIFYLWVLPGLFVAAGTILLIRRKRK